MSNEEIVKAKWPDAVCEKALSVMRFWNVYKTPTSSFRIGRGFSEAEAWADAAARISESEDQHE